MNFASTSSNNPKRSTKWPPTSVSPDEPKFTDVRMNVLPKIAMQPFGLESKTFPTTTAKDVEPTRITTNWSVNTLPEYYQLERSSLVIPNGTPLEIVISRVSAFLRMQSIKCTFHPESGRIDCVSAHMLKFVVQLWRRTDSDPSSLVLELQRRRGCSIELKDLRRGLFHVLLNRGHHPCGNTANSKQTTLATKLQRSKFSNNSQYQPSDINGVMYRCLQLLESNFQDQNQLGMECLRYLTISNTDQTRLASQAILGGKGSVEGRLRKHIVAWIVSSKPHREYQNEDLFHSHMKSLALNILANILQAAECIVQELCSTDSSMITVVECLVKNLEAASDLPGEAANSAKCLRLLSSHGLVQRSDIGEIVHRAHEYGKAHHMLLENECRSLIVAS